MFQPTWHCCMCYNPPNGSVDLENSWLIKSSCITKDEHKARQLASAKVQQKNLLVSFLLFANLFAYRTIYMSSTVASKSLNNKRIFSFHDDSWITITL